LIVVAQVRRDILRIGLFAGLFFSRFSKPNTGATAVLVDELDAGILEGALDYLESRASWRACPGFQLMNRHNTDTGCTSKILLTPR
jgi:spermidine synthase